MNSRARIKSRRCVHKQDSTRRTLGGETSRVVSLLSNSRNCREEKFFFRPSARGKASPEGRGRRVGEHGHCIRRHGNVRTSSISAPLLDTYPARSASPAAEGLDRSTRACRSHTLRAETARAPGRDSSTSRPSSDETLHRYYKNVARGEGNAGRHGRRAVK